MKRFVLFLCVIITAAGCIFSPSAAADETENTPVYAADLKDGVYNIEVDSSSSMFKIVNCELDVSGDEMTAVMTLSGVGYEKLFMGTGDEALSSGEESYIYFEEDSEGKYTYKVPVEALNVEIDCAAWSIRKEKWYDRVLVFESDTLPEEAFKGDFNMLIVIIPAAVVVVAAIVAVTIVAARKKGK